MARFTQVLVVGVVVSAIAVGCSSDKKSAESEGPTRVSHVEPGVAGGVTEETTKVVVKVEAVDVAKRSVTIADEKGNKGTFTAGPEIRNLEQLKPGDKVTATLVDQLVVYVRSSGEAASATYETALARTPKGARPGGVVAESYEVVATVDAIDAATRTATLKFVDGNTRAVPVRPDVDLSQYKVGDRVVIRVTSTLTVLTTRP